MIRKILTVGYEGASADDLLRTLEESEVSVLVDVREMPLSRKPGLSKKALGASLTALGVAYRHERWLGAPRDIRDALKATRDYAQYFRDFNAYLDTQREALEELASQLDGNVALMCFERDPNQCHRKSVARVMGEIVGAQPTHIGIRPNGTSPRPSLYSRQSVPAA